MSPTRPSTPSPARRQTALLTVVAALLAANLGVMLVGPRGGVPESAAFAQPQRPGDQPFNNNELTRRTAEGVTQMSEKLTRIEALLNKGISVKVTEMPAAPKD